MAAAGVLAGAMGGTIGMIGLQSQLRMNAMNDGAIVEQLRRLVPEPEPGTIFVPLRVEARAAGPGRYCHDYAIHSAFEAPWSCEAVVRIGYRRGDLGATPTPKSFRSADAAGFRRALDQTMIAWERCVPFVVDRACVVRLVDRLTVEPKQGAAFEVVFPRSAGPGGHEGAEVRVRERAGGHYEVESRGGKAAGR